MLTVLEARKAIAIGLAVLGLISGPADTRVDRAPAGNLVDVDRLDRPDGIDVRLPPEWRQQNWAPYGSGSCVHATMVMLFRWQGQPELAEHWRTTYHSGESAPGLRAKLTREGVPYADTTTAEVEFLQWACDTRRGAGVVVQGGHHMVLLVHLDDERAATIDNNHPQRVDWWPRERFLREWREAGGWAITPLYDPQPRRSWR